MRTKISAFILSVVMLLCFVGCSFNEQGSNTSDSVSDSDNNRPNNHGGSSDTKISASKLAAKLFPTFDSARQIYVVDVTQMDADTVSLLKQIQGLVAQKEAASLYYITNEADRFWADYLKNELGVYFSEITFEQMLSLYGDFVETVVLYTPGTFEYEFAWNNAQLCKNAVCATYSAARDSGLIYSAEVIDPRGAFENKQAAYDFMFAAVQDKDVPIITACSEYSEFSDYAFACGAFMLPMGEDVLDAEQLVGQLSLLSDEVPGVIYNDRTVSGEVLSVYSAAGYGSLPVAGFNNATVFSSISTDYEFNAPKVQKEKSKSGMVYMSMIIGSTCVGDAVNAGYSICLAARKNYKLSFEIPTVMYRLAPSVLLWYTINTRQNGDSIVAAGGWTDIDQDAMPIELYKTWHLINNYLMDNCGIKVASSHKLSDTEGTTYGELTNASGIMCFSDVDGVGAVDFNGGVPVISVNVVDGLNDFEQCLVSLNADDEQPLYYVFSIPMQEYNTKLPIYDGKPIVSSDVVPDGYYSITEIIAVFNDRMSDSVEIVSPAQLFAYAMSK